MSINFQMVFLTRVVHSRWEEGYAIDARLDQASFVGVMYRTGAGVCFLRHMTLTAALPVVTCLEFGREYCRQLLGGGHLTNGR